MLASVSLAGKASHGGYKRCSDFLFVS